jgi:hypothetical protein
MELKLQSEIAVEISQRFPNLRGQFFHVSNERNNQIKAFQARAIGIFPGVSDFLFFEEIAAREFQIENCCKLTALEVKEPGSYHKLDHVKQQAEWGQILEDKGGRYFIVTSVQQAVSVVQGNYEGIMNLQDLQKHISQCKLKTIRF